jgi:acyl-CoA thioesterase
MLEHEELLRRYFKRDRIAESFGMEIVEIGEGFARATMKIREDHLNGLDMVHGATIFALGDFTFALASNSHGTAAVGVNTTCEFVKGAKGGSLHASARETSLSTKLATYDITITDDAGATIALFHGMAYRKKDNIADIVASRMNAE